MYINMAPSSKEVAAWVMDIGVAPSVNTDHGHQHDPQQQSSAAQIMDIMVAPKGSTDYGQTSACPAVVAGIMDNSTPSSRQDGN